MVAEAHLFAIGSTNPSSRADSESSIHFKGNALEDSKGLPGFWKRLFHRKSTGCIRNYACRTPIFLPHSITTPSVVDRRNCGDSLFSETQLQIAVRHRHAQRWFTTSIAGAPLRAALSGSTEELSLVVDVKSTDPKFRENSERLRSTGRMGFWMGFGLNGTQGRYRIDANVGGTTAGPRRRNPVETPS